MAKKKKNNKEDSLQAKSVSVTKAVVDTTNEHLATSGEGISVPDVQYQEHKSKKINNKYYLEELGKLQIELVKLQEWIK